jgi:hypothetical protein
MREGRNGHKKKRKKKKRAQKWMKMNSHDRKRMNSQQYSNHQTYPNLNYSTNNPRVDSRYLPYLVVIE